MVSPKYWSLVWRKCRAAADLIRTGFGAEFPQLTLEQVRPFLPFRYLVSGGVGLRSLMPGFTHNMWAAVERVLRPQMSRLGMFAFISLCK